MELTREEAIRLHRELWGWLAENPMKQKTDYPKFKTERVRNDCYLCEFAGSQCAKCPVEWPKIHYSASPCLCVASYYDKWDHAKLPEERSRLAALIRDLPEKKVESKPKFKVGDRVRVKEDLNAASRYDEGCYFDLDMAKYRGKTGVITKEYSEDRFYLDLTGNRWRWSPSMLEPAEPPKPVPRFSVGDKVVPVSKTVPGFERDIELDIYWRKSKERGYLFVVGIEESLTKSAGKTVYMCNYPKDAIIGNYFLESDLRPYVEPEKEPTPEPKTVVIDNDGNRHIFNGPVTVLVGRLCDE